MWMLEIGLAFLALMAAVVGVRGDTWDANKKGWKRLTPSGRRVVAAAVLIAAAMTAATVVRHVDEEREAARRAQVEAAARSSLSPHLERMLRPLRTLHAAILDPGEMTAEQPATWDAILAILERPEVVERLESLDLRSESHDTTLPERHAPLYRSLGAHTQAGVDGLRQEAAVSAGYLDPDLLLLVFRATGSPFARSLVDRVDTLDRLAADAERHEAKPSPAHLWPSGDAGSEFRRWFRDYVAVLRELARRTAPRFLATRVGPR